MIGLLLRLGAVLMLTSGLVWSGRHAWQAQHVPVSSAAAPASAPAAPPDRHLPLTAPALSQLGETLRRPLFFEGRTYPVARQAAPPPVAQPGAQAVVPVAPVTPPANAPVMTSPPNLDGLRLLGVMVVRGEARALVEAAPGRSEWLGVGKAIREWTIERISADRIVLRNGRRSAALDLYTLSPASPAPAQR